MTVTKLLKRVVPRLDRAFYRATGGRTSLSGLVSGLPVVLLTTTGARTRQPRSVLLLALYDADRIVVTGANWGGARNPAWYYNLLATPEATATTGRVTRPVVAYEAEGVERERLWAKGLARVPVQLGSGWTDNPHRRIPVMVLAPRSGSDTRTVRGTADFGTGADDHRPIRQQD